MQKQLESYVINSCLSGSDVDLTMHWTNFKIYKPFGRQFKGPLITNYLLHIGGGHQIQGWLLFLFVSPQIPLRDPHVLHHMCQGISWVMTNHAEKEMKKKRVDKSPGILFVHSIYDHSVDHTRLHTALSFATRACL